MRRKVLSIAVAAMVAVNVGLWAAPQPAVAQGDWGDCGCAISPKGGTYGFCAVFLKTICSSDADCGGCEDT